jgi:hypothetical protein
MEEAVLLRIAEALERIANRLEGVAMIPLSIRSSRVEDEKLTPDWLKS